MYMPLLSWKKDRLISDYDLFIDGQLVGDIRSKSLSATFYVEFKGKKFFLETEGLSQRKLLVIDMQDRKTIGEIKFSLMGYKANISLLGNSYTWKFNNMFYTKWSIYNESMKPIISSKKFKGDSLTVSTEKEILLTFCGIICAVKARHFGG